MAHESVYEKVARERAAKMVTVRKVGRTYELYAPGASEPFATRTKKADAVGFAWTYARYKLRNDAMTESGSVIAEGFEL
jgi:hypothetical protein